MTSPSDAPTGRWSHQTAAAGEWRRGPTLLALALALLVPALILVGAAGFSEVTRGHELLVVEQLRAIALLKVGQIERWLTERRQDAELLSTSPVLLRDLPRWLRDGDAVVDASSDAIYAKDSAGTYLLFNRAAAGFCATTPEAVLGRDDHAIFPPEQAALIMAHDRQVMAEDRIATFQEELTTAQGSITFLATKGPLHDAAGQVVGLFGIARDITERARAEDANRSQLDELRRWQRLVLGREARILELKQEVNTLLARTGQGPRYPSATGSVDPG
jgi:PAS domain S-box-containing protein